MNFEELSPEERLEKLRELKEKIEEENDGEEDIDVEGEFTVNVYDEDGNLKETESQKFKY